jgi:hypothetical protein
MWTFNKSFKTSENCGIIESCSGTDGVLQHGQLLLCGGKLLNAFGVLFVLKQNDRKDN